MRVKVKTFTTNLQNMVIQKTKDISDILESIEQGIVTINLDLSLNDQYSQKAKSLFKFDNIQSTNLKELLQVDLDLYLSFLQWVLSE